MYIFFLDISFFSSKLQAQNIFSNKDFSNFPPISVPAPISIPALTRFPFRPTVTPNLLPTSSPTLSPTTIPTPTVIPLPHIKKLFFVSGGVKSGPKLSKGFLDPYGPIIGDIQTINIYSSYTSPIDSVQVMIKTDHLSRLISLSRISGTETLGEWQGNWTVDDTTFNKYKITFMANSMEIKSTLDINLR